MLWYMFTQSKTLIRELESVNDMLWRFNPNQLSTSPVTKLPVMSNAFFTMLIDLWCNSTLYNASGDLQPRSTDPFTMLSFFGTSTRLTIQNEFTSEIFSSYWMIESRLITRREETNTSINGNEFSSKCWDEKRLEETKDFHKVKSLKSFSRVWYFLSS